LRFHTQTAGSSLTAQQPDNNIVRTALQALSAVLGGTQSLHTNSLDEALALPTEHSAKIALRTQQIIAHETGVTNTVDPLAGSYYVEWMTDEIERQALDYMRRIDEIGGALRAIESGWIQVEIQEAAYRYQREVEKGERIVVGMNAYQEEEPSVQGLLRVDPAIRAEQIRRLKALRERRDQAASESALARLQRAAEGTENLMPSILACVEAWCTMGEICGVLRRIFGEYHERITV
jgi:methylmalonyl-CoA mutase N-terminal domain/subunit